jgi:hypothetical protein
MLILLYAMLLIKLQMLVDQDRHDEIVLGVAIMHFLQLNLKCFAMLYRMIPFW